MTLFGKDILQRFFLTPASTLHKAMEVIDRGGLRIALVVDHDGRLIGIITDGDIRRALLRGLSVGDPIETVYCRKPSVARVDDPRSVILQKALDGRHQQIPIVDHDGRPVGIEEIHELVRPVQRANTVVIMAGGQGSRLRPLTAHMPKPMLKVGNKPLLEHTLDHCRQAGFSRFILCVNYLSHIIKDHFGDGARFGVSIEYVEEEQFLGTAGALGLIDGRLTEPFLVMNGDLLTELDYGKILDFHINEGASATMCVRQYDLEIPFGVVNVDKNVIAAIEEKPLHKFLVNAGIYALSPEVLQHIPANARMDMPDLFNQLIQRQCKVISFLLHEYWLDIGRWDDFERANQEFSEVFCEER